MGLCRTCLAECPMDSVDIFDDNPLKDVLSRLIRLEIICDERLPRIICNLCHDQIQNSQSFIKKALESNALLCTKINADSFSSNSDIDVLLKLNPKISTNDTADKEIQVDNEYFNLFTNSSQTKIVNCNSVPSDDDDYDNDGISKSDSHYPSLDDCEIKLEPEEYEDGSVDTVAGMMNGISEEHEISIGQIKIEPLSENDALKFHRGEIFVEPRSVLDVSIADSLMGLIDSSNNGHAQSNGFVEGELQTNLKELVELASEIPCKKNVENKNKTKTKKETKKSCSQCGKMVPKKLLLKHRALHRSSIQKCILCDKRFKTRKRLKTHVEIQHSYYELLKCQICDMTFMHSTDLQEHTLIHIPPKKTYHCSLCNTDYDTDGLLTSHLYIHKEIVVLKKGDDEHVLCSRCNRCFMNSLSLLTHIKSMCKDNTNSKDIVELNGVVEEEEEEEEKKEEEVVQEKEIYESPKLRVKIERPTRNHKVEKVEKKPNYEENTCPHCSQTFSNKYFLRIHVENHGSYVRDYCCPICLFKFKRKDHLKRHLTNVHGLSNPRDKVK